MNDFYGMFKFLRDMNDRTNKKSRVRKATHRELDFVNRFIKFKKGE